MEKENNKHIKFRKILDFFDILRIRILNFVKEHKYVSIGAAVLTASIIIAFAVRAEDTISSAHIESASVEVSIEEADGVDATKIPNFTTVTYALKYKLNNNGDVNSCDSSRRLDDFKIVATLPGDIDTNNIKWNNTDETARSEISEDGKTITIHATYAQLCSEQNQLFTLNVLNAVANTKISPIITVYPGTSISNGTEIESGATEKSYARSTAYASSFDLVPYVNGGIAKYSTDTERHAIFNVMLGVNTTDTTLTTIKGAYFDIEPKIHLSAYQGTTPDYLNISTSNNSYGVYNKSLNYFSDSKFDLSSMSGSVTGLQKANLDTSSVNTTTHKAPVVTVTGPLEEVYEKAPSSTYYKTTDDTNTYSSSEGTTRTTVIKNSSGTDITSTGINLNTVGTYHIYNTFSNSDGSTTVTKTIKVETPQNTSYRLKGAKTIYVVKNSTYAEPGLYNTNEYSYNAPEDLTATTGSKTIKYYVNSEEVASRTIKVVDSLPNTATTLVQATDSVAALGSTYTDSGIKVGDNSVSCSTSSETCSYVSNPSTATVNTSGINLTYNYKGNDTWSSKISKKVFIIAEDYVMTIKNIKPTFDSMLKINNNFYAIASYYVTAISPRSSGNTGNITVSLKATVGSNSNTGSLINSANSTGEASSVAKATNYVLENGDFVEVTKSATTYPSSIVTGDTYYTAAMGENVKHVSKFSYGYDADKALNKLVLKVKVDDNLIPIAYSNDNYFDIKAVNNGEDVDVSNVSISNIKFCTSSNVCSAPTDMESGLEDGTATVSYILITLESSNLEMNPGIEIEISTLYQVKSYGVSIYNNLLTNLYSGKVSGLSFKNESTFTATSSSGSFTKNATSHTAYITAYKLRTVVGVGFKNDFNTGSVVTFDATKNDTYTLYASPSIIAPAMIDDADIFSYSLRTIPLSIVLPSGIEYSYNKEYDIEPSKITYNSNGTTTLLYYFRNVKPNEYIEPLYIDFNIDVTSLASESQIKIYSGYTNSSHATDFSVSNDVSSRSMYKDFVKTVKLLSVGKLTYGQYTYQTNGHTTSNIDKNGKFKFVTKLHNNSEAGISGITTYTVLPYNGNESKYEGSISLKGLTSDANKTITCTSDEPSTIDSSQTIVQANYQSCDTFKNASGSYVGVTAYKVVYNNTLAAKGNINNEIEVTTSGNTPGDTYMFKSYLKYDSSDVIGFRNISIDVISKKITGTVWEDFNVDGIMDDDENRIQNVELRLYDLNNILVMTTTPDSNGLYTFKNVGIGTYYIVAAFNTEQYGITKTPTGSGYNSSKVSVFKKEQITDADAEKYTNAVIEEKSESDNETVTNRSILRTNNIEISTETHVVKNANLGLSLKKVFEVEVNEYINKAQVTNALGITTTTNYNNTKLAKLDVKRMNNIGIKVFYVIELHNTKYYPGYVRSVLEAIPDGMTFNKSYKENEGWELQEDGTLINTTLKDDLMEPGDKKYLTLVLDVSRKEAGSFINTVSVDDLDILGGVENE